MSEDIAHRARIAVTELHMRGRVDDLVGALLDRIEELEAQADEDQLEIIKQRSVADIAEEAIDCKDYGYDPSLSQAQRCVDLVAELGRALAERKLS